MRFYNLTGRGVSRAAGAAAAALAGLALAGCHTDNLVSVQTPEVVLPSSTTTLAALPSVFNSAISEMSVAFAGGFGSGLGGTEGQILYSGLLGDEILLSDTFPTRREIDYRSIQLTNSNNESVFRQLQVARVAAERVASAYAALKQPRDGSLAEAQAIAGYAYILFAENYCGGVPFASINNDGTVNSAPANTTAQILAIASAKFDTAIAITDSLTKANGGTAPSQAGLARVGKARVLLDQGNYAAAAAVVSSVATTYQYTFTYSNNTTRQNNGVWGYSVSNRRFSVANAEGTNGLNYRAAGDPRVLTNLGNGTTVRGFDNSSLYIPIKYSEINSPAVLASGVEARLIEAEAAMNANNYASALTTLNALRNTPSLYACPTTITVAGYTCPATQGNALPALTDPGTAAGRVAQLFRERAFWLFLTSHRLGDMRRLSRGASSTLSGYGLGATSVFPVGSYVPQANTVYGSNVAMPVPFSEQTGNSQYDPNACDPNQP